MTPRTRSGSVFAPSALAVAAALALLSSGAQAFEFDTGNPDLSIRWDNTVRFNLAARVEGRDPKIGNSAIADEGTYSFDKGDMVAKRLDLLSEFDVVYKKRYGARVSGTGWYDAAYGDTSQSNPNAPLIDIPSYIDNQYSSHDQAPLPRRRGRVAGRLRLRRRRPRRRAGAGQARPPHALLGRVAVPRRQPARHRLRAEPARPAEGLRDARHRGQGAVPAAEPVVGAGPGDRHAVARRRSTCSSGSRRATPKAAPTSARWTSSSTARTASSCRRRSASPRRGAPPSRSSAASSACPRAGAPSGSTARWASTTATSPTSCRRPC